MVEDWYMEEDHTRLKGLYPASARQIQPCVERLCDRLEYEGSPIFDEYPDPCTIRRYGSEIYREIRSMQNSGASPAKEMYSASYGGSGCQDSLSDLIELLLCQEIFVRRCRRAECKKCR